MKIRATQGRIIVAFWILFLGVAIGLWIFTDNKKTITPNCPPETYITGTRDEVIQKIDAQINRLQDIKRSLQEEERISNLQARP